MNASTRSRLILFLLVLFATAGFLTACHAPVISISWQSTATASATPVLPGGGETATTPPSRTTTASLTPSASATPPPSSTPTPPPPSATRRPPAQKSATSAAPLPTRTPVPPNVPPATSTPTPTPVTPTAWPRTALRSGTPARAAAILSFTASSTDVAPGQAVTLTWTTRGLAGVTLVEPICCTQDGQMVTRQLPANGSLVLDISWAIVRDRPVYHLTASTPAGFLDQSVTLRLPCPDKYFFAAGLEACPAGPATNSAAVEQRFQYGRMIWLEAQHKIFVLFDSGRGRDTRTQPAFLIFDDPWKSGDPETDPAIVPPDGLYQPVRGFGALWRTIRDSGYVLRERLGWAVEQEHGFDGACQRPWFTSFSLSYDGLVHNYSGPSYYAQYLRASDGSTLALFEYGAGGWDDHSPQHWDVIAPK